MNKLKSVCCINTEKEHYFIRILQLVVCYSARHMNDWKYLAYFLERNWIIYVVKTNMEWDFLYDLLAVPTAQLFKSPSSVSNKAKLSHNAVFLSVLNFFTCWWFHRIATKSYY